MVNRRKHFIQTFGPLVKEIRQRRWDRLLGREKGPPPEYDLVFVIFEKSRGWILEAICREIAAYSDLKVTFHYTWKTMPTSRAYFYVHYSFFLRCLRQHKDVLLAKNFVWYTHPREDFLEDVEEIYSSLLLATKVICPSSESARALAERGIPFWKRKLVLGGADPQLFPAHVRKGQRVVGLSMAFYERKRPERVLHLVQRMTDHHFILLGRGWAKYERFDDLQRASNFEYIETDYASYPAHYARMDVFVAPSDLEGGPISLIEAMMSNVVPVACRTGFAEDIIQHGKNGFIFEKDAPVEIIEALIRDADLVRTDVRRTVEKLTWKNFSRQITKMV